MGRLENRLCRSTPVVHIPASPKKAKKISAAADPALDVVDFFTACVRSCKIEPTGSSGQSNLKKVENRDECMMKASLACKFQIQSQTEYVFVTFCLERGNTVANAKVSDPPSHATTVPTSAEERVVKE